jgi:hypothetical protein
MINSTKASTGSKLNDRYKAIKDSPALTSVLRHFFGFSSIDEK